MMPTLSGMDDPRWHTGALEQEIGRAATATKIGETVTTRRERTELAEHVRAMRNANVAATKTPTKANKHRARTAGDRARQRVAGNRRWTPPKGRR